MSPYHAIFDGVLACTLPVLALAIVVVETMRAATALYIAFGLLCALAWTRLGAIDIALVEAAIGAGLTGALLVGTLSWSDRVRRVRPRSGGGRAIASAVLVACGAVGLGFVIAGLPDPGHDLAADVFSNVDRSGATHPVTAVLLVFRGYDTMLEIVVLLVAALATHAVRLDRRRPAGAPAPDMLDAFAALLVPFGLVVSGYLVWEGAYGPGGAFQAGAVLAGCGIVMLLAGRMPPPATTRRGRYVLLFGPAFFVALAAVPLLRGDAVLEYSAGAFGALLPMLELALELSIAIVLVTFFAPVQPHHATSGGGAR